MKKKWKIGVLLFGLAIFSYLVWDFGLENIVINIKRTGWWFAPVIGVWVIVYVFNAWAWFVIIRDNSKGVSFGTLYSLTITGLALNYVTPFLNLGGEPYRVLALRERLGLHRAVSSVILYNMVRMLSHFFFWLGAVGLVVFLVPVSLGFGLLLSAVSVAVFLLIFFFFSRHRKGVFESFLSWVSRVRILRPLDARLEKHRKGLLTIDGQIKQLYNEHRGSFYRSLASEFIARVVASFEFFFILKGLGFTVSIVEALYINAAASLILNLLFFMPFELGTREGGLYFVMQSIGYASGIGIYIGLANRIRELFWIFVGFLLMLRSGPQRAHVGMMDIIEEETGA